MHCSVLLRTALQQPAGVDMPATSAYQCLMLCKSCSQPVSVSGIMPCKSRNQPRQRISASCHAHLAAQRLPQSPSVAAPHARLSSSSVKLHTADMLRQLAARPPHQRPATHHSSRLNRGEADIRQQCAAHMPSHQPITLAALLTATFAPSATGLPAAAAAATLTSSATMLTSAQSQYSSGYISGLEPQKGWPKPLPQSG
jgi:hypothetical protein